jgi:hypothetical protein
LIITVVEGEGEMGGGRGGELASAIVSNFTS